MKKIIFLILFGILQIAFASETNKSNEEKIKTFIISSYQERYAASNFKHSFIQIKPMITINLNEITILSMKMGKNALSQKDGIVIITAQRKTSKISLPISYTLEATLEVLRATALIKTTQNISILNAKKETIPMQNLKSKPIAPNLLGKISAKSLISANAIITQDKIQSQILVRKGEMINGFLTQDKIQVQVPLKALENGTQDQVIKAMNPESKKILRIQIVDNNLGKIL